MSINSTHPLYDAMKDVWEVVIDSNNGERAIKKKEDIYLPPTRGMIEDGHGTDANSLGAKAYKSFVTRAVYPDDYKEAVRTNLGSLHRKEASILLPDAMEHMRENCTPLGETMLQLLRRINMTQCATGRLGLLADITTGVDSKPYISTYNDLSIRNWDCLPKPIGKENKNKNTNESTNENNNLRFVVLDESGPQIDDNLRWTDKKRYRVVALVAPDGGEGENKKYNMDNNGVYGFAVTDNTSSDVAGLNFNVPNYRGTELDSLPFVFINASDNAPEPENPPLLGLADLCLAIYRGEGDYRRNLSMQGEDTLVTIGEGQGGNSNDPEKDTLRTGAGSRIKVPLGGDAKYIGVSADGLSEQRTCLENDNAKTSQRSGILVDSGSGVESGDALKIRTSAQTATLPQIAMTGAAALEKILKLIAVWIGADPDQVVVIPNLEFIDEILDGAALVDITTAKLNGAPLSWESIHGIMVEKGFTKMTYADEMGKIDLEIPMGLENVPPPAIPFNPDTPDAPDDV